MMKKPVYVFLSIILVLGQLLAGCQLVPVASSTVLNLPGADPITLDPALSGEGTSHQYITQLFSGLVRLDDEMTPAPDIAREWRVSSDGCTYTFTIRQDVKFHNGSRVTAQDFKYSWERACQPETGSRTAITYLGDIVGAKDV
ncbi:MAG: ABC transporter substrate-binding protein, partial [Chloroflexota bacterium]